MGLGSLKTVALKCAVEPIRAKGLRLLRQIRNEKRCRITTLTHWYCAELGVCVMISLHRKLSPDNLPHYQISGFQSAAFYEVNFHYFVSEIVIELEATV